MATDDLYGRRTKCPYCNKTYVFTTGLQKHKERVHWDLLVRDFPEKYGNSSAQAEPTQSEAPHGPECPCGRKHAPLTSTQKADAEAAELRVKARNWDKLIQLLPTIEGFLAHVQLQEALEARPDVPAPDNGNTTG